MPQVFDVTQHRLPTHGAALLQLQKPPANFVPVLYASPTVQAWCLFVRYVAAVWYPVTAVLVT